MEEEYCTNYCVFNRIFVPSFGNPNADIMLVGEAPGRDELVELEPFVGKAGQLLDRLLELAGLRREQLYVANTCACVDMEREDKRPLPEELRKCRPRLLSEILEVNPKIIVALGSVAHTTFAPGNSAAFLRGKLRAYPIGDRIFPVIFTYHPARALPFRNPEVAPLIQEDLEFAKEYIAGTIQEAT